MVNPKLKQGLAETNLCKYLDANELDLLMTYSIEMTFVAGADILQQGKKSEGIFILLSGAAEMTAKVLGAGTLDLGKLTRGDFIGEISLFDSIPNTVSVTAINDVDMLFISGTYFETLALFFGETKYRISKAVAEDVCSRVKSLQQKIARYILQSQMAAKSFFGEVMQSLTWPREIEFKDIDISAEQLKKCEFFNDLTDDEFSVLFNSAMILSVAPHSVLIKGTDKEKVCYIILRGAVQSSIVQENKFAKLSVLPPFTFFAGMACIDGSESTINFNSCERTILLKLTAQQLTYFQEVHPALWYKIFNEICKSFVTLESAANKLDIRLNSELYNR